MQNVFVYCELTEEGTIAEVSLELLSKGRKLADELGCELEAILAGDKTEGLEGIIFPFGVDVLHIANAQRLFPYTTLLHTAIVTKVFKEERPDIALFGATAIGRDLAPRVASYLRCGLTADCTGLEIGSHIENKTQKEYNKLLYQIRPAFGGNIIATIINPETKPQMATVREGVMKKEIIERGYEGQIKNIALEEILIEENFKVKIIERHIEPEVINIKGAQIIISGGYGVGTRENFQMLYELAAILGAEVGASRAAVDAGFAEHARQIGQTGITVRPKLYIAFGISGAVQHRAGMEDSTQIISVNKDPLAPINQIADYTIIGDIGEVLPKMIKYYKINSR